MSQAVFDVGDPVTHSEHMESTGMAKAMNWIDDLETFRRQSYGEISEQRLLHRGHGKYGFQVIREATE
jgi:hypothetical protein